MSIALKKIEDDALKLTARLRARLAERLIMSLEETATWESRSWVVDDDDRLYIVQSEAAFVAPIEELLYRSRVGRPGYCDCGWSRETIR